MLLRWSRDLDSALSWADELLRQMDTQVAREGYVRGWGQEPAFQLSDIGDSFVVQGLVPGLRDSDIEIQATVTGITIRGERQIAVPEGHRAHRQERSGYRFSRSFRLPTRVDLEASRAMVKDGLLVVELRKQPETLPKSIEVKSA